LQPSQKAQQYRQLSILRCIVSQSPSISHLSQILFFATLLLITPRYAIALLESDIDQQRVADQQQRDLYQQATKALSLYDFTRASGLIDQLSNYPLYPYLLYQRHRLQIDKLTTSALQQFSNDYADSPLPSRLHRAWLSHLGKHKHWQTLLDNYQPRLANTSLQCLHLWALHQTGRKAEAFSKTAPLWTQGSSQPSSCDKLFTAWMKSSSFSEQYAWERFWLALENNNLGLAKYSKKLLQSEERQRTAEQALELHRTPKRLITMQFDPDSEGYQQLLENSLDRLSRSHSELALLQLQRFNTSLTTNKQEKLQHRFGLRLLRSYPESLAELSQQINLGSNKTLLEWQLRNLLIREDWQAINTLINTLPASMQSNGRWRYWKARSLESLPEADAQSRATSLYTALANERSFYGFLSADKLGKGYSLNNQTELADSLYLQQLSQSAPLLRARELIYHQQRSDARREWHLATRNLNPQQLHHAAQLARQWGWYEQAISSAISAKKWNDLLLRFPLAYGVEISDSAQSNDIDTSWILAIARQESGFKPDARSPAGALGLMQLMPRTAKATARQAKLRYQGSQQLVDPELNIKLGSHYLASLSRRYAGHRVLASAAYNAGPTRVNRWLEQRQDMPIDIWIETIPFDETRNYVQNILSFSVIYSDMLGQPKQLLKPHEHRGMTPPT